MLIETLPTTTSPFQAKVLAFRKHCNIFNGGGRGSGKTVSLMFDALDHVKDLGPAASVLLLRESWAGISEVQYRLHQLATLAFGPSVSQNKSAGTLEFPSGGRVFFRNIADDVSFASSQGKSYSFLGLDEYGGFSESSIRFSRLLRSNIRPPRGVRGHIHITANPFGRAHTHCLKTYINKAPPFTPYEDEFGALWINAASTLTDNPFIDNDAYRKQLQAATAGNPGLAAAWISGDWMAKGGGLMFDLFDPRVHLAKPPRYMHRMKWIVGVDWGTASPSVAVLVGELLDPVGTYIPGDVFVFGMVDTVVTPGDWSEGDGTSASAFAAMVKSLLDSFGLPHRTRVVVDDARGLNANETVVGIFREQGLINAEKPERKNRAGGWALIRMLLAGAKHGDSHGLWIDPGCQHLIETMELAPRDQVRTDDIDRHYNQDHALDATSYALTALKREGIRSAQAPVIGHY